MDWIIYYGDGTTFNDSDGAPNAAPALNVQAIACRDGVWGSGDLFGLFDYLMRPSPKGKVVKFGRLVTNEEYQKAADGARNDPNFHWSERVIETASDFYWFEGEL